MLDEKGTCKNCYYCDNGHCENSLSHCYGYSVDDSCCCAEYSAEGKKKKEAVNHPAHYNSGGIECIEAIQAALGAEKFEGFLIGNVLKYLWRYPHKNGVEDLRKARFYLNYAITEKEYGGLKNGRN